MKPILVNNQQEWLRLAPVLEKQGWIWCNGGEKPTKWSPPIFPCAIRVNKPLDANKWYLTQTDELYCHPETQSVDEYIGQVDAKPLFNMPIYKPTDYKELERENKRLKEIEALYEAQTRAIQEALEEIESLKATFLEEYQTKEKLHHLGKALAYEKAKEILTQKLGYLPNNH